MQSKTFCQYLDTRRIIHELIRFRVDEATRRHPAQRLASISPQAPEPFKAVPPVFTPLFPSRRQWKRHGRKDRLRAPRQHLLRRELASTVFGDLKANPYSQAPWRQALAAMVESIQALALSPTPRIDPPETFTINKDNGGTRTIHAFRDPAQRTLLALLQRYLSERIDPSFSPSSYAFRKDPNHGRTQAVQQLQDYRQTHAPTGLFVTECDLRDFFDHIPHTAIRNALAAHALDPQSLLLVDTYLDAGAAEQSHGIPQGGALSPLLANLVLTAVDDAVASLNTAQGAYYARFCDDILVAHPQESVCRQILDTCLAAIAALGLPYHAPMEVTRYAADFYAIKSKLPYLWGDPVQDANAVLWVSFLGYQIRHDGRTRVRKASLRKQMEKQQQTTEQVRLLIQNTQLADLRISGRQILERTTEQLVAMSVGRIRNRTDGLLQPCWADAFPLLDANPSAAFQCKTLDRCRERNLRRLKRALIEQGCLKPKDTGSARRKEMLEIVTAIFGEDAAVSGNRKQTKPIYRGAPFSYYAALTRKSCLPYTGYAL